MPRRKSKADILELSEAKIKLLCDHANNQMKVQNYTKALALFNERGVTDILGPDKEDELLQSFVQFGLQEYEEDDEPKTKFYIPGEAAAKQKETKQQKEAVQSRKTKFGVKIDSEALKKRKPKEYFSEIYTDKDRAAAVSAGSYDIKQSLKIKRKQDRTEAALMPEEADPSSLLAMGMKELKNGNIENAVQCISKALEISSSDVNALISRSKCYLLLGEAAKALDDAEAALKSDKNNIRAIYQKAESLYYLGQFEQSLMFFHRGLRLRPELALFRLGVQKTQEAIENTIGVAPKQGSSASKQASARSARQKKKSPGSDRTRSLARSAYKKPTHAEVERRISRKLLGELCVDKEYLENLLKHPDLKRADTNTENISALAKDAVEFLNKRQEFWRQQKPCTALPNQSNFDENNMPGWF